MAIYRRMNIGTAKPSAEELARVPHHCVDIVEPSDGFDVSMYCAAAERAVTDIRSRGKEPLFVGGTPLYLMAFFKGLLEGPERDDALRAELEAREDAAPGVLLAELKTCDPETAERLHRNDRKRLVRALEVYKLTGKPISAQQDTFENPEWRVPCKIIGIARDREDLHERVKLRTRAMLAEGLVEEVRAIRDDCGFAKQAAAAIGYAEVLKYLDGGWKDEEELRNRIRRNTHKLIRRQMTWLRRLHDVSWFQPDDGIDAVLRALRG